MPTTRREYLGSGVAVGSLFLPLPYAEVWAQSEGSIKLLRWPKIALVAGNSRYKEVPLKNPANDAKAIGEALKGVGFAVTSKLDASLADMTGAIDADVKELAAKKCVGLFYYAGHGLQLAWRNYILPVDAEIDTIDDVQKRGVEIKVADAKIEDVFKRVRLSVRRKSNGAQIPWESTSLEDDFYFIPPKELKKLSDQEKVRLYKKELAF